MMIAIVFDNHLFKHLFNVYKHLKKRNEHRSIMTNMY